MFFVPLQIYVPNERLWAKTRAQLEFQAEIEFLFDGLDVNQIDYLYEVRPEKMSPGGLHA